MIWRLWKLFIKVSSGTTNRTICIKGAEIEFVCKGSYGSQEGTSFAAARATGVVSRTKSDYQNVKGEELRELLKRHVHDMGDKGRDIEFGYGRLVYLDVRC